MERQFQINWSILVEEARQRRKLQKLTQVELGKLAGVSTPTISRFESKETDIQLPTVLNIFRVLGMIDQRELVFDETTVRYDPIRDVLIFIGKDGDKSIPCAISGEALEDYFHLDNKQLDRNIRKVTHAMMSKGARVAQMTLILYDANRERIQHEARRKYLANQLEPDGSVLIKAGDF